jgi:hypothetical protein
MKKVLPSRLFASALVLERVGGEGIAQKGGAMPPGVSPTAVRF